MVSCGGISVDRWARNDFGTQPGVRREHTMEANEMKPRVWDERGQTLHELQGRHHDMGCAIAIGCLQREHHLPGTVECQPLVGHGGAGDIPTQVLRPRRAKQGPSLALALEFLPLMGGAAHLGMPPQSPAH